MKCSLLVAVVLHTLLSSGQISGPQEPKRYLRPGYEWTVGPRGHVYAVDAPDAKRGSGKYVVLKYNKDGTKAWERQDVPLYDLYSFVTGIAVDNAGSAYVACKTPVRIAAGGYDAEIFGAMTMKYDASGELLRSAVSNVWDKDAVVPVTIAVDGFGCVYVTGSCGEPERVFDIDAELNKDAEQDSEVSDGNEGDEESESGEESGPVGFTSSVRMSGRDIVTIKHDSEGSQLWAMRYGVGAGTEERPVDIVPDKEGSVYVVGTSETVGRSSDIVTLKYDGKGSLSWERRYTAGNGTFNTPTCSALQASSGVFVTGTSTTLDPLASEIVTIKYGANGEQQWVSQYRDSQRKLAAPEAIVVDGHGNSHVLGYAQVSPWDLVKAECVTIKYDPAGKEMWVAKYERSKENDVWLYDLRLDRDGNVYAIGCEGAQGLVVKYDANGKQEAVTRFKTVRELVKFLSNISIP
jgi:hypothetical protein